MHIGSSSNNGSSNIHLKKRQRTDDKIRLALVDFEIFECPICVEPLVAPIFQCDNGHFACSSCCPKLKNKCPFCALSIGDKRCRAMEKVLESVSLPCLDCTKNVCNGQCTFSLWSCPAQECMYTASYKDLYDHFNVSHQKRSILNTFTSGISYHCKLNINDKIGIIREHEKSLLFVVQCFKMPYGVYVAVCCIAPSSPEVEEFSYDLSYTMDGQTMIYQSFKVKKIYKVSLEIPQDNFMLIPQSLLHGDLLNMNVLIKTVNQV